VKHIDTVVCLLISLGCIVTFESQDSTNSPAEFEQLVRAQAKWQASKAVSYEFKFQYSCGFVTPQGVEAGVLFQVKNGNGQLSGGGDIPAYVSRDLVQYSTVDRLFDFVLKALKKHPSTADVQCDAERGYPTRFCVDQTVGRFEIGQREDPA